MDKKIYKLVSTSPKRIVESPFCLCGVRTAAFYLEEAALRMVGMMRDVAWCKTVYGCYAQPDGTFLIGPSSARPVGKFRQTLALREVKGKINPDIPIWKSVTSGRVRGPLTAFAQTCLRNINLPA